MKDYEQNSNGQYYLPIKFTSHMSLSTHFLYVFVIVFSLFLAVYFSFSRSMNFVIFAFLCALCGIYALIQWIFYGVLKLGKIEIDDRELVFKTITSNKRVPWEKVNEMGTKVISGRYGAKSNVFHIGLSEEDDELPFFRKILAKLFGVRGIEYGIPISYFPKINRIKLMRTINVIIDSRCPRVEGSEEYEDDVYPEDEI